MTQPFSTPCWGTCPLSGCTSCSPAPIPTTAAPVRMRQPWHLPRQQAHLGGHTGEEQPQGAMGAPRECQVVSVAFCHLAVPAACRRLSGLSLGFSWFPCTLVRLYEAVLQGRLCCSRPHVCMHALKALTRPLPRCVRAKDCRNHTLCLQVGHWPDLQPARQPEPAAGALPHYGQGTADRQPLCLCGPGRACPDRDQHVQLLSQHAQQDEPQLSQDPSLTAEVHLCGWEEEQAEGGGDR